MSHKAHYFGTWAVYENISGFSSHKECILGLKMVHFWSKLGRNWVGSKMTEHENGRVGKKFEKEKCEYDIFIIIFISSSL